MDDSSSDPRDWSPDRRAKELADRGMPPVLMEEGEVSNYRGVLLHWTSTLDTRITFVIDEILGAGEGTPLRAWAHKGSCGFLWDGTAPWRHRPGEGIDVVEPTRLSRDGEERRLTTWEDQWIQRTANKLGISANEAAMRLQVFDVIFERHDWWIILEFGGSSAAALAADAHIASLEALPYDEYLQTSHWLTIRQQAFDYYGKSCVLCSATSRLQIHHRDYANVGRETMADLIALCRDCHARYHRAVT